ncbi:MAG TPA: GAF domain-containing sensor histidine kinase [Mycobacterium sp.]
MTAITAVSTGLDLEPTLHQIVDTAAHLLDARYAALGVLDNSGKLDHFVHAGMDDATAAAIGAEPGGTGVLGVVIDRAEPLRLDEISAHPASAGFPSHHPVMHSFLGVPINVRGEVFGRLYLADKNTGLFTEQDETVLLALAGAAGVAVQNARLYEQAVRRERWLEATGEVVTELLADGDSDRALKLVASRALELTAADTAMIAVPSDPGADQEGTTDLRIAVCVGHGAESLVDWMIPIQGSTTGAVFSDHLPRNVAALAFEPLRSVLGPAVASPLRFGQSLTGVLLTVRSPGSAPFDQDDARLVTKFADHAALALREAERQAAQRKSDVFAERDRIARDLHDHVIQRLFGIGLSMLTTKRSARPAAVVARIGMHMEDMQQVVREIRAAIFDLQIDPASEANLRTTLKKVISEQTENASLRTAVRMTGPLDLMPADLAQNVEAAVREAVSNAVRHAHASELTVTISVNGSVVIDVTDNGVGIPSAVAESGLHNLRTRAAELEGTFSVAARPEGGTRLVWMAPLRRPSRDSLESDGMDLRERRPGRTGDRRVTVKPSETVKPSR